MNKITITFIFIVFSFNLFGYSEITDWEGKTKNTEILLYKDDNFITDDGALSKEEAAYIKLNIQKNEIVKTASNWPITEQELLRRASYLNKKYPNYPKVVLFDKGIQRLNEDGSRYSRSRYIIKINNESELESGKLSFYFDKGKNESTIIMARSVSPDGTVTYLDPSTITFTTRQQGLQHYSGNKSAMIMQAQVPNVQVGSIIDYEWESIEFKPEDPNQFYASWYFNSVNPVYDSYVDIMIPKEKDFYYFLNNVKEEELTVNTGIKGKFKIYTFSKNESAPLYKEPDTFTDDDRLSAVFGSLYKDQKYLSKWLAKYFNERIIETDKLKETVNQVLEDKDATTEKEKIAALYRFMQDKIRYVSIKTSLSSGFAGHIAEETFNNKYGDCIDKSILFTTLLNIANVKSYPVIVKTNDAGTAHFNRGIGIVSGNHAITEVHLKNGDIQYLDCTSSTHKYPDFREDDHGIYAWNPILNTVRTTGFPNPDDNTQTFVTHVKLKPDGSGSVNDKFIYNGSWESGLRGYFANSDKKSLEKVIKSLVASKYPGGKLKKYNNSKPDNYDENFTLNMKYTADNIGKTTNNLMVIKVPQTFNFEFSTFAERKTPLKFTTVFGKKYIFTINIPKGFKVKGYPDILKVENKYFTYRGEYKVENNKLILNSLYQRKEAIVPPGDEYKSFRDAILKVDYFVKSPIVLEKE